MPVIRSKNVVTPEGVRPAAIHIEKGVIRAVEPDHAPDAADSFVLPGLVDIEVHINEPGHAEWEGFWTATRAAAAGGFTTLVDMPVHSVPPTGTLEAWSAKRTSALGKCWVDCGFWGAATPGNIQELDLLWRAGVLGFRWLPLSTEPARVENGLKEVLLETERLRAPLLFHVEDVLPPSSGPVAGDAGEAAAAISYHDYLASFPPEAEQAAVERVIRLGQETHARIHISHLSASGAASLLGKGNGHSGASVAVTAGTNPHYLYFAAEDVPDGATAFKCAPPIRERNHQAGLWGALLDGSLDLISTGHSPAARDLRQGGFGQAWPGIASLQVALAAVWTARRPGVELIAKWMAERPADLAGLGHRKGKIAPGYDADFVIWNPQKRWMLMPQDLHHRQKITPYVGCQFQGEVEATFLRGRKIYEAGQFAPTPSGQILERRAHGSGAVKAPVP